MAEFCKECSKTLEMDYEGHTAFCEHCGKSEPYKLN